MLVSGIFYLGIQAIELFIHVSVVNYDLLQGVVNAGVRRELPVVEKSTFGFDGGLWSKLIC
jgi:hypothetical protein